MKDNEFPLFALDAPPVWVYDPRQRNFHSQPEYQNRFTVVEPQNRWKNLAHWHELYCAGHLMEAAVAHYEGTGKRTLLDVMCRYADYMDSVFGPGKRDGCPGHEEIELALVKLYHATGEERYLKLSQWQRITGGRIKLG